MSGSVRKNLPDVREACRMSKSGQKAIPNVRERSESLPNVREWSGGPAECPGVVGKPSRMSRRPFGKSGRPSQMSGSGRVALSDVQKCLRSPP